MPNAEDLASKRPQPSRFQVDGQTKRRNEPALQVKLFPSLTGCNPPCTKRLNHLEGFPVVNYGGFQMPFCTQCGAEVRATDTFCGACGTRQSPPAAARESQTGPFTATGASAGFSAGPSASSGAPRPATDDLVQNIDGRKASIFCYIPWVGFIGSIIVLASTRFRDNKDVRFHAFQGLYLFVLWLFVDWVFGPLTGYSDSTRMIGRMMKLGVVGAWIFMIVKTSQNEMFRLPFLGELADRSVSEQK
jgi:uncharacterized membrane protein